MSAEEASQLRDLEYRSSLNQVRHEPMPASHHADQRQEASAGEEGQGRDEPEDRE